MCVSSGPADFSKTTLVGYVPNPALVGENRHVLLYQNSRRNLQGEPNCMLLHIDAAQPMGHDNFIDTTAFPNVAKDLWDAVKPQTRSLTMRGVTEKGFNVFDVGSYTVVLTGNPTSILAALDQVPPNKRPIIKPELLNFYADFYPLHRFALCCFDDSVDEVEPMMFWWVPRNPDLLVLPALDAHTGNPPDIHAHVEVDHRLVVSHFAMSRGEPVQYTDAIPSRVRDYLPLSAAGGYIGGRLPNGDFAISVQDLVSLRYTELDEMDFKRLVPGQGGGG